MSDMTVHFSSNDDTWTTPQEFFDALDSEFHFTLDAAALSGSAKVKNYYGPDHASEDRRDALAADWKLAARGGAIWLNPPYGRKIGNFVAKARFEADQGATVVMLIPARTDTSYWHDHVMRGEVRFVRGRLYFGDGTGRAPFPSAVVIFRPEDAE